MGNHKLSEYSKYIVLSDKSDSILKGNFASFLNFQKVLAVINELASSDKTSFIYEGNIYSRRITATEAQKILMGVQDTRWSANVHRMLNVASQLSVII
tara:strand:- start:99 stop:392 length:294 start_codon:yes stop_codon:yes gene_type:complete